jgi:hypothetical protein
VVPFGIVGQVAPRVVLNLPVFLEGLVRRPQALEGFKEGRFPGLILADEAGRGGDLYLTRIDDIPVD